jgi:hypothetical protein
MNAANSSKQANKLLPINQTHPYSDVYEWPFVFARYSDAIPDA